IFTRSTANAGFASTAGATNGNFSITLTIPINQKPDVWTITVDSSVASESSTIDLYAFDWQVSPRIGSPGSTVQIVGDDFPPNRVLPAGFSASNAIRTNLGNITASKVGRVAASFTVPANATVGK